MADYGSGAGGAVTGAYVGSTFGPVGTAAGAVIGGAAGLFGKKKRKKKPKKLSTLDPKQQQLYNDYIDSLSGQGPYSDMYQFNPEQAGEVFDKSVARPAYRSYEENVIPKITGQYRSGNIMNSSYSAEALARSGRDVQESLDAERAKAMYQGQQDVYNRRQAAMDKILGTSTFAYQKPEADKPGMFDQVLNQVGNQAGEWFADYLKKKRAA